MDPKPHIERQNSIARPAHRKSPTVARRIGGFFAEFLGEMLGIVFLFFLLGVAVIVFVAFYFGVPLTVAFGICIAVALVGGLAAAFLNQ